MNIHLLVRDGDVLLREGRANLLIQVEPHIIIIGNADARDTHHDDRGIAELVDDDAAHGRIDPVVVFQNREEDLFHTLDVLVVGNADLDGEDLAVIRGVVVHGLVGQLGIRNEDAVADQRLHSRVIDLDLLDGAFDAGALDHDVVAGAEGLVQHEQEAAREVRERALHGERDRDAGGGQQCRDGRRRHDIELHDDRDDREDEHDRPDELHNEVPRGKLRAAPLKLPVQPDQDVLQHLIHNEVDRDRDEYAQAQVQELVPLHFQPALQGAGAFFLDDVGDSVALADGERDGVA